MSDNVTVAKAITQLREQLEDAQHEGQGKAIRFLAKTIEVELAVVFKTEAEAGVGVKAWFLDVSAKGKRSSESGHKVKFILEPVGPDGKNIFVSGPAQAPDIGVKR